MYQTGTPLKGNNLNLIPSKLMTNDDFLEDEILSEQFTRNVQFFGLESQLLVHNAFVVVVGLGGVGSNAAVMLLRSGVGRMRLVDFDQVSLSSLNRHAVATRGDVGMSKALCLRDHFARIFPECRVDACVQMYDKSTEEDVLRDRPDFVLDCIDNIDTKVRHRLRREHGIESGIPVVFSTEKPKAKLLPFQGPAGENSDPSDYQVVPGFRVRIIPVMGTIPAIFGQVMASYVIAQLARLRVDFEPIVHLDSEHFKILHQRLVEREELRFRTASEVEVDVEEVAYVVREVWRGRSARDQSSRVSGRGLWRYINKLTLTRWDSSQAPSVTNLALFTFQEAEEHDAMTLDEIQKKEPEFYSMVSIRLQRAARDFGFALS